MRRGFAPSDVSLLGGADTGLGSYGLPPMEKLRCVLNSAAA